ncbi:aromatic ring-hydroxylating oxygenase subunit alpha [Sulfodiicoccus acidiphilus]|nr:Rieske 2Fe-2S domain-containing protein [Sulfodiicoccus acidiphilus]
MRKKFLEEENGEIPLKVFNSEEIYEMELRKIFSKNWVFLGLESEIPEPGDYVVRYIGNDPFIVIRGSDGKLRALFNSCRHRGTMLCINDRGNASTFMCPYHGWTYNNKGELVGVPFKEKVFERLDVREWGLLQIRVDSYDGLVFGNMDENAPDLQDYLGDFKWYLDLLFRAPGQMEPVGPPQRWTADFDWKLGAENFAEDRLHIAVVHRTLQSYGFVGKSRFGSGIETPDDVTVNYVRGKDGLPVGCIGIRRSERETSSFLGYPREEWKSFKEGSVSRGQWEVLRRAINAVFTLFPNFSGLVSADSTDSPFSEKPRVPFHTFRVWNPVGPGVTEVWMWTLVPSDSSPEFKKRVAEVTRATFGAAGNAEMDDLPIWRRVTRAAKGVFAERANTALKGGLRGVKDLGTCQEWEGPGLCRPTQFQEESQRTFWTRWALEMTKDE